MADTLTIGITCYPTIGGSGIVATELGRELAKRGHKVHFISYDPPFRFDAAEDGVTFHQVKLNEYTLFKYPDYTLPLAVKMNEVHQKHHLDILHVHYAVPHATAALLARQIAVHMRAAHEVPGSITGPRVVTTLHGTDITLLGLDPNLQPIIEYSIDSSCGVTAVSESLKRQTYQLFAIKKEIKVIYNFYNQKPPTQSRDHVRHELGIASDEIVVIHLSNMRPVKRIPDLLRTAAEVDTKIPIKFLIIAGGNFNVYAPLVDELKIKERVIVKQNVLNIEDYLQAADIGFFPSEDESFGMGILECMSFGLPVVTTRAGGIPEVVDEGKSGMLHTVGDTTSMARDLSRLAGEKKLRDEMGAHARERAQKYFSAESIVNQYIEYYYTILEEKKAKEC